MIEEFDADLNFDGKIHPDWKLGELVTYENIGEMNLLQFLSYGFKEIPIPVEALVMNFKDSVKPISGRVYNTYLRLINDGKTIVNQKTISSLPPLCRFGSYPVVYLKEVWEPIDGEGYSSCALQGFVLVDNIKCSVGGKFDPWVTQFAKEDYNELVRIEAMKIQQYSKSGTEESQKGEAVEDKSR